MLKYFLFFPCLLYFGFNQIIAQNHVAWNFSYDKSSEKIIIKGTIDKGWHLYSQKTPCKNIQQITGKIEYMVCDDTRCIPPIEVPFTIQLK